MKRRRPSRRWPPLYRDMATGIEFVIADLKELARLDGGVPDALWPELLRSAVGCLEGARGLLHDAERTRAAFLTGESPPGPTH